MQGTEKEQRKRVARELAQRLTAKAQLFLSHPEREYVFGMLRRAPGRKMTIATDQADSHVSFSVDMATYRFSTVTQSGAAKDFSFNARDFDSVLLDIRPETGGFVLHGTTKFGRTTDFHVPTGNDSVMTYLFPKTK